MTCVAVLGGGGATAGSCHQSVGKVSSKVYDLGLGLRAWCSRWLQDLPVERGETAAQTIIVAMLLNRSEKR